jgi:hypothetical protein
MDKKEKKKVRLKINEENEAGQYINAVSVHINGNECVIDFGYHLPNHPEPTVKVLSRINMSHRTAESFLKVFSNAVLDWKNKGKA